MDQHPIKEEHVSWPHEYKRILASFGRLDGLIMIPEPGIVMRNHVEQAELVGAAKDA